MRRERSCGSVQITSLDRGQALAALCAAAQSLLAAHAEVAAVRLFGSLARGDHTGDSDADVLIVTRDDVGRDIWVRLARYQPYFDLPIGVDLLVIGQAQLERRLAAGDPFYGPVWSESIALSPPPESP